MGLFSRRDRAPLERVPVAVERRDPKGATLTRWGKSGLPQIPGWSAEDAWRWGYVANAYVWRCIQVRAQAIAGCPFRVGVDPDKPGDFDPTAALARLLGPPPFGPNREISARQLWSWTVAQRIMAGRFAWELEGVSDTGRGEVVGLWPLVARLLEPIPAASGPRYYQGFWYNRAAGEKVNFTPDQVVYNWTLGLNDIREPDSPLQAARYDISVANMQDRYDHAFLMNDSVPASVMVHEQFAEVAERDAFRAQFNGEHRGPDNAGKMAFVEASEGDQEMNETFHIKVLGLSQRDAEFIKRHEQKVRGICVALGTPLSILGDSSGRTFSNAGQEWRNWWEGTVLPDMADLQDVVNMQLAPKVGREVGWFDTSHVAALRIDSKIVAMGQNSIQAVDAGLMTPNEWRTEFDLPEMDGGDELVKAVAPQPVPPQLQQPVLDDPTGAGQASADASAVASAAEKDAKTKRSTVLTSTPETFEGPAEVVMFDVAGVVNSTTLTTSYAAPTVTYVAPFREDRTPKHTTAQAERWRTVDATTRMLEDAWITPVARVLDRHVTDAVRTLKKSSRRAARLIRDEERVAGWDVIAATSLIGTIFDRAALEQDLVVTTVPLYAAVVKQAERHLPRATREALVEQRKAPTGPDDGETVLEAAQRFVQSRANRLAGHVAQTTYEQLQDTLAEGIAAGESVPKLAARIQDAMGPGVSKERATVIARTETISAFNQATRELALEDGSADGFEWIATLDARTRPSHVAANGQQIDAAGSFDVGGVQMVCPGDPDAPPEEIVNCRCALGVTNEYTSDRMVTAREVRALLIEVSLGRRDPFDALDRLDALEPAA